MKQMNETISPEDFEWVDKSETQEVSTQIVVEDTDVKQVTEWLLGKTTEQPEAVARLIPNLEKKLTASMFLLAAKNLERVNHLNTFTLEVERVLFNVDEIQDLAADKEQLMKIYKEANKAKVDTLEYARKMLVQNGTKALEGSVEGQALLTLLNSFSPEQLKQIKEAIISGMVFRQSESSEPEIVNPSNK